MRLLVLMLILLGSLSVAHANELNDFTSDGCSKSPDGIPVYSPDVFLSCCIKHDISYWQGGTEEDRGYSPLSYADKIQVVQKLLKLQSEGISIH